MTIRFTKMHGLGNDFIVINALFNPAKLTANQINALARRDTGIGFDQCLVIEPSQQKNIDFFYRIFNADGQEVGQCGNGARCLARFIQHYRLSDKKLITVATHTTTMQLQINDDNTVTVDMGKPKLNPAEIPLLANEVARLYTLTINNQCYEFHALSLGNPHAVIRVENIAEAPVAMLGQMLSEHPLFPEQANIGFMQIIDENQIRLRVYERGCGETQACGSGAVAAAAVGRLFYNLAEQVEVQLPGGKLTISWPDIEQSIYLTGPASFVYEGELMCE